MSFWDNVKKFAQPYSDEEEFDEYQDEVDEFEDDPRESVGRRRPSPFATAKDADSYTAPSATAAAASTSGSGFDGHVLNMSSGKQEVVLYHAKTFNDAAKAADELRRKKAVILNMENVDKALTRRVVDFLSGSVYALDGSVKKIAQSTYLFCPHNMDVIGDLENAQSEVESFL